MKSRLGLQNAEVFTFYYKKQPFSFTLFGGSPEVAALIETFVYGEYDHEKISNPKVIIDVGAHTGNTAWYFHLRYPEATIYAIEAAPQTFSRLSKNVASCAQIIPIHAALTDTDGQILFYEAKSSLGSSTVRRSAGDQAVTVRSFTLATFFAKYQIQAADLVKVDIEGGEQQLFQSADPKAFSDRYIVEVHEDLMDVTGAEFEKRFSSFICRKVSIGQAKRYMLYAEV